MLAATTLAGDVGRYTLLRPIGSGGMATVHLGRQRGAAGFSRIVAIKRLRPQFAGDPDFVAMFTDEAQIASRIRHPNVVPVVDVVATDAELLLVMDYVHGESLSRLARESARLGQRIPLPIVGALMRDVLAGLHAAHEVADDLGRSLGIVHRDVSPDNVIVSVDGVAQLLDFGIAKAAGRSQVTREGQIKGKLAFMPPEQLMTRRIDRRLDVYAASAMLWTLLTGQRLFSGDEASMVYQILHARVPPPSELAPGLPAELDAIVLRGLSREPSARFPSALDMAEALEDVIAAAAPREVGAWVEQLAGEALRERAESGSELDRDHATEPYDVSSADAPSAPASREAVAGATESTEIVSSLSPRPASAGSILRRRPALVALATLALAGVVVVAAPLRSPPPAEQLHARAGQLLRDAAAAVIAEAAATPADAAPPAGSTTPVAAPARAARASKVERGGPRATDAASAPPKTPQGTLPSGDRDYGF